MRLRSFLVIAIVSLLLGTVLLVGGSTFVNAKRAAQTLSAQVLAQAAERIELRVRSELDVAVAESALAERRFAEGELHAEDLDGIARFEVDVLSSRPTLSYLSFSRDATGDLAQASRVVDGSIRVRFLRRSGDDLLLSDYAVEPGGLRLIAAAGRKNENDGRLRPFYLAAQSAMHPIWTETYAFFGEGVELGTPGVTYATPIKAADGRFVGVLTADFDLVGTSQFLQGLDLFPHGGAFIVEYRKDGSRAVIAHPKPQILARDAKDPRVGQTAVGLEEIPDPVVVAFGRALPAAPLERTDSTTQIGFDASKDSFIGSYRSVGNDQLRWTVCVFAPEEDILGEVRRNNRTTLAIVVVATLVAIAIALWFGASIAGPLRAVADETEAIGQFRLDVRNPAKTSVIEVARLSAAVEEMKRNLRSFRKYVPAEVVRELVSQGREAELGGRRETLTIHFSDIAGFTTIAETIRPEDLVAMLSEYLDEMTQPILASQGTVDKFIGDAVMAFWGAPRADKDHALHACEAALTNRARLSVLNERWEAVGRPRFDARAALHTGEVIVGNIGSGARLEYTVIGDSVNLASRLEGLNKNYGTDLMISETVYERVKDVMVVRPLDRVSVKGKSKSVDVYELLGKRAELDDATIARAEKHTRAFAAYLERRFAEAIELLRELASADEKDEAARVLLSRCERLQADPPGADWDGSVQMHTK